MKIQVTTADAYRIFHEGILAMAQAEREGIRVGVEYCKRKREHLTRKIRLAMLQMKELGLS